MSALSNHFQYYRPEALPLALIPQKTLGIGLVSWWALDETVTGGTDVFADSHGSAYLNENGPTVVANFADPVLGQVVDFSGGGASSLVRTASEVRQLPYNSDFSICGWVYFDALGQHRCIASRSDNGANTNSAVDWQLIYQVGTDTLDMTAFVGSTGYGAQLASPTVAEWLFIYGEYSAELHHCGAAYGQDALTIGAVTGDMNTGGDQFKFGRRSFSAYPWDAYLDGKMSRWGLWSRRLSDAERFWLAATPRNYSQLMLS